MSTEQLIYLCTLEINSFEVICMAIDRLKPSYPTAFLACTKMRHLEQQLLFLLFTL